MKTRFCPSPTGLVHLGNLRTALFNALLAKKEHGTFLLRIEDTDKERSKDEYTKALQADLKWLGLDWDEGPEIGGEQGPYHQAERQFVYDRYYQKLEDQGLAYPCFCSEEDLIVERKIQRSVGKPPRYSGKCRHLTQEEQLKKKAAGLKPTLRFKVPVGQTIIFNDLVKGEQSFQSDDMGDFIIRRANGTPPFMFCNAVDDATMGVTHALRGEDHLTNTPRQLMILDALGLKAPAYGHIALIIGHDGSPLSKRHGSRSVTELRDLGFIPLAIINYLARLGHYYEDDSFMTLDTLASQFEFRHLGTSPARFDEKQLLRWQEEAVSHMSFEHTWAWMGEALHKKVPPEQKELFVKTVKPNVTFPSDALKWAENFYSPLLSYADEVKMIIEQAGVTFFDKALAAVQQHGSHYSYVVQMLKTELGLKGKALFYPLRAALTNQLSGPELAHVFDLLGTEGLIARLEQAKAHVS